MVTAPFFRARVLMGVSAAMKRALRAGPSSSGAEWGSDRERAGFGGLAPRGKVGTLPFATGLPVCRALIEPRSEG